MGLARAGVPHAAGGLQAAIDYLRDETGAPLALARAANQ
jgi:hypothetical protein